MGSRQVAVNKASGNIRSTAASIEEIRGNPAAIADAIGSNATSASYEKHGYTTAIAKASTASQAASWHGSPGNIVGTVLQQRWNVERFGRRLFLAFRNRFNAG